MVWFYLLDYGKVKHYTVLLSIPLWSDFIVWKSLRLFRRIYAFQSHYGLILSGGFTPERDQKIANPFNPTMVWFYPLSLLLLLLILIALSIPLWSDFIFYLFVSSLSPPERLSIPLWSDFIRQRTMDICSKEANFQSHYGLILSYLCHTTLLTTVITFFQSHYGLILSNTTILMNY